MSSRVQGFWHVDLCFAQGTQQLISLNCFVSDDQVCRLSRCVKQGMSLRQRDPSALLQRFRKMTLLSRLSVALQSLLSDPAHPFLRVASLVASGFLPVADVPSCRQPLLLRWWVFFRANVMSYACHPHLIFVGTSCYNMD